MTTTKRNMKLDEKNVKMLRSLATNPENKHCFDCNQRGPTYVNMTIGSFVCTSCSGVLRGLNPPHRVKSISMATYSPDEIDFIKNRGNDYSKRVWMGLFDGETGRYPNNSSGSFRNEQEMKDFLSLKYEQKRWYVSPSEIARQQSLMEKNKRTTSTSSSQSGQQQAHQPQTTTDQQPSVMPPAGLDKKSVDGNLPVPPQAQPAAAALNLIDYDSPKKIPASKSLDLFASDPFGQNMTASMPTQQQQQASHQPADLGGASFNANFDSAFNSAPAVQAPPPPQQKASGGFVALAPPPGSTRPIQQQQAPKPPQPTHQQQQQQIPKSATTAFGDLAGVDLLGGAVPQPPAAAATLQISQVPPISNAPLIPTGPDLVAPTKGLGTVPAGAQQKVSPQIIGGASDGDKYNALAELDSLFSSSTKLDEHKNGLDNIAGMPPMGASHKPVVPPSQCWGQPPSATATGFSTMGGFPAMHQAPPSQVQAGGVFGQAQPQFAGLGAGGPMFNQPHQGWPSMAQPQAQQQFGQTQHQQMGYNPFLSAGGAGAPPGGGVNPFSGTQISPGRQMFAQPQQPSNPFGGVQQPQLLTNQQPPLMGAPAFSAPPAGSQPPQQQQQQNWNPFLS